MHNYYNIFTNYVEKHIKMKKYVLMKFYIEQDTSTNKDYVTLILQNYRRLSDVDKSVSVAVILF